MCDAKYTCRRWRPITAICLAATDNNPNIAPDAAWLPLAFPNPPDADYPSGHSLADGAAAAVLQSSFGTDVVASAIASSARCIVPRCDEGLFTTELRQHLWDNYLTVQSQAMGPQMGAFVANNSLK